CRNGTPCGRDGATGGGLPPPPAHPLFLEESARHLANGRAGIPWYEDDSLGGVPPAATRSKGRADGVRDGDRAKRPAYEDATRSRAAGRGAAATTRPGWRPRPPPVQKSSTAHSEGRSKPSLRARASKLKRQASRRPRRSMSPTSSESSAKRAALPPGGSSRRS